MSATNEPPAQAAAEPFRQRAREWPKSPISHVRYIAHAVPDFKAALSFYRDTWGLSEVASDSAVSFLAAEASSEPYVLRLRQATEKHLDLIGFGVRTVEEIDVVAASLAKAGVRLEREPQRQDTPGGGYGFRFFDPDGRLVELSADLTGRSARELEPGESIPAKVSHVVLNTPDMDRFVSFYTTQLGFQVIDWLGDFMAFLRVGAQHHVLAVGRSPHASFNHIAFEMRGWDEYMRGTGRLVQQGVKPIWGPGRHGPGNNTFSYFVDPTGNVTEYTSQMQEFYPNDCYEGHVWSARPEEQDHWGTGGLLEEFLPYAVNQKDPQLWTPSPI